MFVDDWVFKNMFVAKGLDWIVLYKTTYIRNFTNGFYKLQVTCHFILITTRKSLVTIWVN